MLYHSKILHEYSDVQDVTLNLLRDLKIWKACQTLRSLVPKFLPKPKYFAEVIDVRTRVYTQCMILYIYIYIHRELQQGKPVNGHKFSFTWNVNY